MSTFGCFSFCVWITPADVRYDTIFAMEKQRTYIAIDLKSFYASVECRERGLDPLTTNLVVADAERTDKTICLAVSPSLKAYGLPGRCRLFEVIQKVKKINEKRREDNYMRRFQGKSADALQLSKDPSLELDYITAVPRMAYYMEYSTRIYQVYLKYIAPEDIHVYSIDEVFMDVTDYLNTYGTSAHELAMRMIRDVLETTGITATAGIAPNMFLAKCAMDIVAKHIPADKDGVRIAELDEAKFRKELWTHEPLTDFWRIGRGTARKLNEIGIMTMGDIARTSLSPKGEETLYKLFGVNAELIIDHAWGYEPCTMQAIKAYKPAVNSIGSGQVLMKPYSFEKAKLIVKEMAESLAYDLTAKKLVCDGIVLNVGYDAANLNDGSYSGEVKMSWYGKKVPKSAHGTARLKFPSSSVKMIKDAALQVYERECDPVLMIRRLDISSLNVISEEIASKQTVYAQMDLFSDHTSEKENDEREQEALKKERSAQEAILAIRQKYGKNAVVKGMDLQDGATAKERNRQIGGHKS